MGADGGILILPLKKPMPDYLLAPFYGFQNYGLGGDGAENAHGDWLDQNKIPHKHYLISYYGTDRCYLDGHYDLEDLHCQIIPEALDLHMTFEEFALDVFTETWSTVYLKQQECPQFYLLFKKYFCWSYGKMINPSGLENDALDKAYQETLKLLGPISSMKISDWAKEILSICRFDEMESYQTWT